MTARWLGPGRNPLPLTKDDDASALKAPLHEAIHSLGRQVALLVLRWIEEAVRGLEPMTNYPEIPDGCEGTAKPCTAPEFIRQPVP